MQNQLEQKNEQIQTLQNQIVGLETDLGTVKKGAWNVVESFGGSSGFTSDFFYVAGTELRISWVTYTGVDVSIVFGISVYKEGQSEVYETFPNLDDQGTVFLQNLKKGNYVSLLDEKIQYAISPGERSGRHRIINNLPGTKDFCPLITRTEKLEKFITTDFSNEKNNYYYKHCCGNSNHNTDHYQQISIKERYLKSLCRIKKRPV